MMATGQPHGAHGDGRPYWNVRSSASHDRRHASSMRWPVAGGTVTDPRNPSGLAGSRAPRLAVESGHHRSGLLMPSNPDV